MTSTKARKRTVAQRADYVSQMVSEIRSLPLQPWESMTDLSAIILAVAHRAYRQWPASEYLSRRAPGGCLIDVNSILDPEEMQKTGTPFWRFQNDTLG